MNITDFLIMDTDGTEIKADAFGDNLAFCCMTCGHPVLASSVEKQRGSDEDYPTQCKGCGIQYFLDIRIRAEKIYIHDVIEPG